MTPIYFSTLHEERPCSHGDRSEHLTSGISRIILLLALVRPLRGLINAQINDLSSFIISGIASHHSHVEIIRRQELVLS